MFTGFTALSVETRRNLITEYLSASSTRLNVNWGSVGRMSLIRPTVKRYLWGHVGSGFLRINLDDAPTAVYLPVQRFRKASAETVYARSRRI